MTLLLSIAHWVRDCLVDRRSICGACIDRSTCERCQDLEAW